MKFPKSFSHLLSSFFGGISLMDRYIAAELIPPFLFCVGLVSSLGVAVANLSDLTNKIVESNLPLRLAIQVLLLKIPEFTAYALPISVLLSTLITYGRLSSDSELIALRSCGVSFYRLTAPAIALSIAATGITFIFHELVVPAANYQATAILVNTIKEEHRFWQTKDIFFPEYEKVTLPNGEAIHRLKSLFYAERFDGKQMQALTVLNWFEHRLNQIVVSDSASWNMSENTWDFFKGAIYQIAPNASYRETRRFEHQQLPLSKTPFDLASLGRRPEEMNIAQAWEYMHILRLSGDEKTLLVFQVRTQQKIAFPFVCVVFGVVGCALGARPQQISRATSFGLSIAIVFSCYLLVTINQGLAMVGILTPLMAAWLPNIIGLGVGGWLLLRAEGGG